MQLNARKNRSAKTGDEQPAALDAAPTITVITVVFNGEAVIRDTVESVVRQNYPDIEYIVVDGGSRDRTMDVLREYQDDIDVLISEPDNGIYDAMNKGLKRSTGQWINFMNAGDRFSGPGCLSAVAADLTTDADVVYGDHEIRYPDGVARTQRAGDYRRLWTGMVFCHQSAFVRREFLLGHPFNTGNPITADFDLFYAALQEGRCFRKMTVPVASISAEGVSDRKRMSVIRAYWRTVRRTKGTLAIFAYYLCKYLDASLRLAVKAVLPGRIASRARKFIHG